MRQEKEEQYTCGTKRSWAQDPKIKKDSENHRNHQSCKLNTARIRPRSDGPQQTKKAISFSEKFLTCVRLVLIHEPRE